MNKYLKIVLIVGIFLMLLGFALSSFDVKYIYNSFIDSNSIKTTKKEKIIEENEIDKLIIRTNNEKVTFVLSDDDKIKITYYESKYNTYNFTSDDKTIKMTNNVKPTFGINFGFLDSYGIIVMIPKGKALNYDIKTSNDEIIIKDILVLDTKLVTSNSKIEISNIDTTYNIEAKTSNSKIILKDIKVNNLNIYTSNGNLNITNVIAKNIDGKTSNSKVSLANINTDKIKIKTSNSNINFKDITSLNIDFKTSNGDINGSINGTNNDYKKDLKTSNGSIKIDNIHYSKELKINDGINSLILKTSNSNIKISFK